jgi:hypothetical protein
MPLFSSVAYGKVVNVCMFLNKEVVPVAFDTTIILWIRNRADTPICPYIVHQLNQSTYQLVN